MAQIKVLYVEDEPFLGKIVKESLESRDFEVRMITDGSAAVPAFERFQPDICILDVMLPNRDGFAIGAEIRQRHPHLPILFLTAKNQTEDVLRGFQSGGNDYIRKPFSMEELIARMHNLLQLVQNAPSASPGQDAIPIGKYTFRPQKYELQRGDQVRKLSHRENELLMIFCENRHLVVQRKDILQKVWGDDSFFNSRNLDVYITKLRDYLKDDPSVSIITLKGVGYQFTTG